MDYPVGSHATEDLARHDYQHSSHHQSSRHDRPDAASLPPRLPPRARFTPKRPAEPADRPAGFKFSLNTATIRGQKLSLAEEVEIAAKAGYHAIEPWLEELHRYVTSGGKAADLKKRIADLGLVVPSAIGFADWIDDDDARRAAGLEQWKRDADLVASIGGIRMAAPPSGAYNVALDLRRVAERYRKLLDISCPLGIVPELEMWGGAKTLSRMSQIAYVLVEVAHPDACGLLDIFHIFKGGSDFAGVRVFNGSALHVLHVNDYPAGLTREKANDSDRVYPGDGAAPIVTLLARLASRSATTACFRWSCSIATTGSRTP